MNSRYTLRRHRNCTETSRRSCTRPGSERSNDHGRHSIEEGNHLKILHLLSPKILGRHMTLNKTKLSKSNQILPVRDVLTVTSFPRSEHPLTKRITQPKNYPIFRKWTETWTDLSRICERHCQDVGRPRGWSPESARRSSDFSGKGAFGDKLEISTQIFNGQNWKSRTLCTKSRQNAKLRRFLIFWTPISRKKTKFRLRKLLKVNFEQNCQIF